MTQYHRFQYISVSVSEVYSRDELRMKRESQLWAFYWFVLQQLNMRLVRLLKVHGHIDKSTL